MQNKLNNLKTFFTNQKGFTLIELLIVIAIIGVLVTIVIIAINPAKAVNDARDSRRRSDLQQIKAAMQLYYNDCKFYPTVLPSGTWGNLSSSSCDDNTTYMRNVPTDPSGSAYRYASDNGSGSSCDNSTTFCARYTVVADIKTENSSDTQSETACSAPVPSGTLSTSSRVCND